MRQRILTFDLGTTGIKCSLFGEDLSLVASTVVPCTVRYPAPDQAEQDPEEFWTGAVRGAREILERTGEDPGRIAAIGLSGHMNGCLPVSADGRPLHPHILHSDCRSDAEVRDIVTTIGFRRYADLTGNRPDVHYTLPKILWLRKHRPEVYRETAAFLASKDFLAGRLTGDYRSTDLSDASLMGMLDIRNRCWSGDLVRELGLDEGKLPVLHRAHDILGGLTPAAADALGLPPGIPVTAGGGDGACATAGAGALRIGEGYCYIGGTAWIGVLSEEPVADPSARLFHYADLSGESLVACGTVQNAALAVDWVLQALMAPELDTCRREGRNPHEAMEQVAASVPPGSNGVLFLPYLMGERTPFWDDRARGAFLGLGLATSRADMVRSAYEGVAYALGHVLQVFESLSLAPAALSLIGGGALSRLWTGLLADVWNRPVRVPDHPRSATSLGAAIAAAVGIGRLGCVADAAAILPPPGQARIPDPERAAFHGSRQRIFQALYPALRDAVAALAGPGGANKS